MIKTLKRMQLRLHSVFLVNLYDLWRGTCYGCGTCPIKKVTGMPPLTRDSVLGNFNRVCPTR